MPLGSPIGSGMGIRNPYNIALIREAVDGAGGARRRHRHGLRRRAGDGARLRRRDGRLSHLPRAGPRADGAAMRAAVQAGRLARTAGRIPRRLYATSTSTCRRGPA
jgi:thiazole synthase